MHFFLKAVAFDSIYHIIMAFNLIFLIINFLLAIMCFDVEQLVNYVLLVLVYILIPFLLVFTCYVIVLIKNNKWYIELIWSPYAIFLFLYKSKIYLFSCDVLDTPGSIHKSVFAKLFLFSIFINYAFINSIWGNVNISSIFFYICITLYVMQVAYVIFIFYMRNKSAYPRIIRLIQNGDGEMQHILSNVLHITHVAGKPISLLPKRHIGGVRKLLISYGCTTSVCRVVSGGILLGGMILRIDQAAAIALEMKKGPVQALLHDHFKPVVKPLYIGAIAYIPLIGDSKRILLIHEVSLEELKIIETKIKDLHLLCQESGVQNEAGDNPIHNRELQKWYNYQKKIQDISEFSKNTIYKKYRK